MLWLGLVWAIVLGGWNHNATFELDPWKPLIRQKLIAPTGIRLVRAHSQLVAGMKHKVTVEVSSGSDSELFCVTLFEDLLENRSVDHIHAGECEFTPVGNNGGPMT